MSLAIISSQTIQTVSFEIFGQKFSYKPLENNAVINDEVLLNYLLSKFKKARYDKNSKQAIIIVHGPGDMTSPYGYMISVEETPELKTFMTPGKDPKELMTYLFDNRDTLKFNI